MIIIRVEQRLNTAQRQQIKRALKDVALIEADLIGASFRLYDNRDRAEVYCTRGRVDEGVLRRVQSFIELTISNFR